MDTETLTALNGSIAKWEKIVRSTKAQDVGPLNCPLCFLFYDKGCAKCPVFIKTGVEGCKETPHPMWVLHVKGKHYFAQCNREPSCKECLKLAKDELKFLKSLLPGKGGT